MPAPNSLVAFPASLPGRVLGSGSVAAHLHRFNGDGHLLCQLAASGFMYPFLFRAISYEIVSPYTRGKGKPVKIQEAQRPKLNNAMKVIGPRLWGGGMPDQNKRLLRAMGGVKIGVAPTRPPQYARTRPRAPPLCKLRREASSLHYFAH